MVTPESKEVDPLLPSSTRQQLSVHNKSIAEFYGVRPADANAKIEIKIQHETFRFTAYLFFWGMAGIATLLTRVFVKDRLLQGLADDQPACPPFQHNRHGFDIDTDSHLMKVFGFNNICANWDYSPSREITALFYPIFEYTLLIYLVADFVAVALAYQKGWVSSLFWRISCCTFPIMILLCSWFRMIFVIMAYENVRGHTAGFLGLQLVLMMVACLNVGYIIETRIEYKFLGGRQGTRSWAIMYLVIDLTVSAMKFWLDSNVVLGNSYPTWGKQQVLGSSLIVGQAIDCVWMLFNAMLPLAISYVRSKSEQPLEISVDMLPPRFILEKVSQSNKGTNVTQP